MEIAKTKEKNPVEIINEISDTGAKIERIIIDGIPVGIMGSISESDREKAIQVLNTAYNESGGDIGKMISVLNLGAICTEKEISPDKQIDIEIDVSDGDTVSVPVMISYSNMAAYDMEGNEIANLGDIATDLVPGVPDSAVDAILADRCKLALVDKIRDAYRMLSELFE